MISPLNVGILRSVNNGRGGRTIFGSFGKSTSSTNGASGGSLGASQAGGLGIFKAFIEGVKVGILSSGIPGTGESAGKSGNCDVISPNDVGEICGRFRLTLIFGLILGGLGGGPPLKLKLTSPRS